MRTTLFRVLSLITLTVGLGTFNRSTWAATFGQQEVNQNRFIVLAAPYGNQAHQLLILEQLSNDRACWQERGGSPIAVDPLLTYFDFTGICERNMDSNGYSLRIAGQDLGLQYSLRMVKIEGDLRLVAMSNTDRTAAPIEIGRVNGIPNGFSKIILNPGWRLTKRTYNGRQLGHVYLTRDDVPSDVALNSPKSTTTIVPVARVTPPRAARSLPVPSATKRSPQPTAIAIPVPPPETSGAGVASRPTPQPQTESRVTAPSSIGVLPVPNATIPLGKTQPTELPTVTVNQTLPTRSGNPPAPPTSNRAAALGYNYRVVVLSATADTQSTVKSLAPDAFRINLNGQTAIQAGLFKEWDKAEELRQKLDSRGLPTRVLPIN